MKWRTVLASASPMLSIAQCLVAQVDYNSMNLPMKILSEKGMEIVEEGFWILELVENSSTRTASELKDSGKKDFRNQ